eukprot:Skav215727  [mRNA]  locus=scaffold1867:26287:30543:+ [translate_table: standard]
MVASQVVAYESFWGSTGECSSTFLGAWEEPPPRVRRKAEIFREPLPDIMRPRMQIRYGAYPVATISGYITNPTNDYIALMEALVEMGYGKEDGVGYWTEGYIRLIRHDDEGSYCGWDNTPSHGSLCADENVTKWAPPEMRFQLGGFERFSLASSASVTKLQ